MNINLSVQKENTGKYIPQLDSLRAIVVILVIISHWFDKSHFLNRHSNNGIIGVTIFFVLSGYLITGILLRNKKEMEAGKSALSIFKIFYIRRALRILPIYYLLIIGLLIFNIALICKSCWWHFFYASNFYFWLHGKLEGSLSHFWSLAVEEQFYLIWPSVILFIPKKNLQLTFIIGICTAVVFRYLIAAQGNDIGRILMPGSLDSFCIGGLMVFYQMHKPQQVSSIRRFPLAITVMLAVLVLCACMIHHLPTKEFVAIYFLLISLISGIIIFGLINFKAPKAVAFLFKNRFILFIGKISYGMYLFHNFIPYIYGIEIPFLPPFMNLYIAQLLRFSILLVIASLSWYIIEKPILKLKGRFNYQLQPAP